MDLMSLKTLTEDSNHPASWEAGRPGLGVGTARHFMWNHQASKGKLEPGELDRALPLLRPEYS